MKVEIYFTMDKEEDGIEGTVNLTRENVDSLQDLLYLYQDAAIASGYTYVESIGAHKDSGDAVWSGF
jgi:hypothetical protein